MTSADDTAKEMHDSAVLGIRATLDALKKSAQNARNQAQAVDVSQPREDAVREGFVQAAFAFHFAAERVAQNVADLNEYNTFVEALEMVREERPHPGTESDRNDFYADVKSSLGYTLEETPSYEDLTDGVRELADRSETLDKLIKALGLNRSQDVVEQAEILAELAASAVDRASKTPVDETSSIPPLDTMRAEKLAELGAQVKRINAKPKDVDPEPNNSLAGIYWVNEVVRAHKDVGYLGYLGGDVRHAFVATLFIQSSGKAFWSIVEINQESLTYPDKAEADAFLGAVALHQRDGNIPRIQFKQYESGGLLKGLVVTGNALGMGWLRTGRVMEINDKDAELVLQFPDRRGWFDAVKVSPSSARPPKLDELRLYLSRVLEIQVALKKKSSDG